MVGGGGSGTRREQRSGGTKFHLMSDLATLHHQLFRTEKERIAGGTAGWSWSTLRWQKKELAHRDIEQVEGRELGLGRGCRGGNNNIYITAVFAM